MSFFFLNFTNNQSWMSSIVSLGFNKKKTSVADLQLFDFHQILKFCKVCTFWCISFHFARRRPTSLLKTVLRRKRKQHFRINQISSGKRQIRKGYSYLPFVGPPYCPWPWLPAVDTWCIQLRSLYIRLHFTLHCCNTNHCCSAPGSHLKSRSACNEVFEDGIPS